MNKGEESHFLYWCLSYLQQPVAGVEYPVPNLGTNYKTIPQTVNSNFLQLFVEGQKHT